MKSIHMTDGIATARALAAPEIAISEHSLSRARPAVRGLVSLAGRAEAVPAWCHLWSFRPREDGSEYHTREVVARDFSLMAASGVNTVRVYTVPPVWLLDLAQEHGLLVFAGLP